MSDVQSHPIGYWSLATGYWLLITGYWSLATGYWLLITGYPVREGSCAAKAAFRVWRREGARRAGGGGCATPDVVGAGRTASTGKPPQGGPSRRQLSWSRVSASPRTRSPSVPGLPSPPFARSNTASPPKSLPSSKPWPATDAETHPTVLKSRFLNFKTINSHKLDSLEISILQFKDCQFLTSGTLFA